MKTKNFENLKKAIAEANQVCGYVFGIFNGGING